MDQEKYLDFISLRSIFYRNTIFSTFFLDGGKDISYDVNENQLTLAKSYILNGSMVRINFHEDGSCVIYGDHIFKMSIKENNDDFYYVESDQSSIDFYLEKEIITFINEETFRPLTYRIKFNKLINFDFKEFPEIIKKYFPKLDVCNFNQQHRIMFFNIDIEII